MGVGKRVCRGNSNFDVIICCVETLMVRYYLGVCECMLAHAGVCVCVCVCWGGGGEKERERERERESEQKYSHYKLYKLSNFAMCN